MITTARELLDLFDALPEREKHDVTVELLRRSVAVEGGLSDEALTEAGEQLFLELDVEEAARNAQSQRAAG